MKQQSKVSRRTMSRGVGATLALPWFESLASAAAKTGRDSRPPLRMAFLYVPNGIHMPDWTPTNTGADFALPSTLQPLAPFRSQLTVLSGLTLNGARALGDGGGDHARSVAAFLTGAHPKKTDGADIHNGASVDQVAAAKIGMQTRLASLQLGTQQSAQAGHCDSGYSCVYTSNMSWRSATSPVAKETNPAAVFDRLFASEKNVSNEQRAQQSRYRKSILHLVSADAQRLRGKLSGIDRQKLDEYLYAVRDIERRVSASAGTRKSAAQQGGFSRPTGIPRDFAEHVRVMFDLMALALQTHSTRIITFMYTNAGSTFGPQSLLALRDSRRYHPSNHQGHVKHKGPCQTQRKCAWRARHHLENALPPRN